MARFIARHAVAHGRDEQGGPRIYAPGEALELPDETAADQKLIAALRKANAIALPNELEAPEDVAARQARLEDENAALRDELEALRALQAANGAGLKGGKSAKAAE